MRRQREGRGTGVERNVVEYQVLRKMPGVKWIHMLREVPGVEGRVEY